jgi:hypothetical protein
MERVVDVWAELLTNKLKFIIYFKLHGCNLSYSDSGHKLMSVLQKPTYVYSQNIPTVRGQISIQLMLYCELREGKRFARRKKKHFK